VVVDRPGVGPAALIQPYRMRSETGPALGGAGCAAALGHQNVGAPIHICMYTNARYVLLDQLKI
jgi:hypothetical protein